MKNHYRIIMKIANEYVITDNQKAQKIDKWMDIYLKTQNAEEISIFKRDKATYKLIFKNCKRRVGF